MAKQIFFTVNIETGKSVGSVNELKTVIKNLRAELQKPLDANSYAKLESQIKQANRELKEFNRSLQDGKSFSERITDSITDGFKGIGASIVGAFAVEKIIEFGAESVRAFQEAEVNAVKLKAAVNANGGLQQDFQRLIDQSEELQKKTIFSDDAIQQAQTAALQFGLSADQIEKLIPTIADFASATGQDLQSALDGVLRGIDGNAKGLKIYGLSVDSTKSKTENLASITDQLNVKFKDQADVVSNTSSGAFKILSNQFDDTKENIGGFFSELANGTATIAAFALNGFQPLNSELEDTSSNLIKAVGGLKQFQAQLSKIEIAGLEGQISRMQAAGVATTDLENRLKSLKGQKIQLDISGLEDDELIKTKQTLEELKKNNQITFYFNTENAAKLSAIDEELKKRHLDEIANQKDLTKVTIEELNKRKSELEKINSISADDAISAIDKEIKRREDLAKKSKELRDKALKDEIEGINAEVTAAKAGSLERLQLDLDAIKKEEEAKRKNIDSDTDTSQKQKLEKTALLYDEYGKKIELKEKEIADKRLQIIRESNAAEVALTQDGTVERINILLAGIEKERNEVLGNSKLIGAERFKAEQDFENKVIALRQQGFKIIADTEKEKLDRRKSEINSELAVVKAGSEKEVQLKTDLAQVESEIAKNAVDARLSFLTYQLEVGKGLNEQEYQEYLTLQQKKAEADAQYSGARRDIQSKSQEDEKQALNILKEAYASFFIGIVDAFNQTTQQRAEERLQSIHDNLDAEIEALDIAEQKERGVYVEKDAVAKKYDAARKAARDKSAAEEKKIKHEQAVADRNAAIVQSLIATFVAIAKALPNVFLAEAVGIAGGLQTAAIAAQPIPYERGGLIKGKSHAQGGIPAIVQGITPVELEDEEIILNKNVSRNPVLRQIASELNSTTGGVSFAPPSNMVRDFINFQNSTKQFEYGGMAQYQSPNKYAFDSSAFVNNNNVNVTNSVDFSELKSFFSEKLNQPVKAYVLESEITNAQTINRTIERRASFND